MARDSRRVADWVGLRNEMTMAGLAQVALAAAVILASFDPDLLMSLWTPHVLNFIYSRLSE
ncbi:MAG: hypothetical protein NZM04_09265 [Methylacidiphilales bacterium]|nr:hypothetical protein [Candidatus Methylacidiphilales bacterium]